MTHTFSSITTDEIKALLEEHVRRQNGLSDDKDIHINGVGVSVKQRGPVRSSSDFCCYVNHSLDNELVLEDLIVIDSFVTTKGDILDSGPLEAYKSQFGPVLQRYNEFFPAYVKRMFSFVMDSDAKYVEYQKNLANGRVDNCLSILTEACVIDILRQCGLTDIKAGRVNTGRVEDPDFFVYLNGELILAIEVVTRMPSIADIRRSEANDAYFISNDVHFRDYFALERKAQYNYKVHPGVPFVLFLNSFRGFGVRAITLNREAQNSLFYDKDQNVWNNHVSGAMIARDLLPIPEHNTPQSLQYFAHPDASASFDGAQLVLCDVFDPAFATAEGDARKLQDGEGFISSDWDV